MTSRCKIFYTSRIHSDTPLFSQPTQQVLPMSSTQPYGGCNLISRNISHYLILWAKARMLCFRVIKGHATTSAPIRDQPRPTIPAKDWGSLGLRIHRLLHGVVIERQPRIISATCQFTDRCPHGYQLVALRKPKRHARWSLMTLTIDNIGSNASRNITRDR